MAEDGLGVYWERREGFRDGDISIGLFGSGHGVGEGEVVVGVWDTGGYDVKQRCRR